LIKDRSLHRCTNKRGGNRERAHAQRCALAFDLARRVARRIRWHTLWLIWRRSIDRIHAHRRDRSGIASSLLVINSVNRRDSLRSESSKQHKHNGDHSNSAHHSYLGKKHGRKITRSITTRPSDR
jgi:hypothetical protein